MHTVLLKYRVNKILNYNEKVTTYLNINYNISVIKMPCSKMNLLIYNNNIDIAAVSFLHFEIVHYLLVIIISSRVIFNNTSIFASLVKGKLISVLHW